MCLQERTRERRRNLMWVLLAALAASFFTSQSVWAQFNLENPQANSFQSGIGVISGWVCQASRVDIEVIGVATVQAAYGTARDDTASTCGDANNGFGYLVNWNDLGNGTFTLRVLADGTELTRVTFTVTTLGASFLRGVGGQFTVANFQPGPAATVRWEESLQNFVIRGATNPSGGGNPGSGRGVLENPARGSFQSGIGVISGWVCQASRVDIEVIGVATVQAAYGTVRDDTASTCGDTNNGFGYLVNWNDLGNGTHTLRVLADGTEVASATFTVSTLGTSFLRGASGQATLDNFPVAHRQAMIQWQESAQNFVIAGTADLPLQLGRQTFQSPLVCAECHPRQFNELRQAVHAGYRNMSPTFNGLELAGNALVQYLRDIVGLQAIQNNLRPVYTDTPRQMVNNRNMVHPLGEVVRSANQMRAAFCVGCHNPVAINIGEIEAHREVPEWDGALTMRDVDGDGDAEPVIVPRDPNSLASVNSIRPLRDFHLVTGDGCGPFGLKKLGSCEQVFPAAPGGPPPPGALPSLGAASITCDHCHNVLGPDHARSLQNDGFANTTHLFDISGIDLMSIKTGPFPNPVPVRDTFHTASSNPDNINYIRSSLFCNSCHDVRPPNANAVVPELSTHTPGVGHYRLENLSTEHFIGPYNCSIPAPDGGGPGPCINASDNPFGQRVRCQDCHMSLFPYAGDSTYTIRDNDRNRDIQITSPTPGSFPMNTAASANATEPGFTPPVRPVTTHQFTGVDIPLLTDDELRARLGADYPSIDEPGVDEYGTPLSIRQRREDLLKAAVRVNLDLTDQQARLGETFHTRVTAVALTGHRHPAGFSQERTTYIQLTVSAKRRSTNEDFILYQSGYVTDKPHPETGELVADGYLDDEDLEHITAIANPFLHSNEVFYQGPDNGSEARIFEGKQLGLVLFRNELLRILEPAAAGQTPGLLNLHPRTGEPLTHSFEEETFSAGFANAVDNWRSLHPLRPRTFTYAIDLPSVAELAELGVELEGPLQVHATVHFNHFPPLFLRFLARVGGAVVEQNLFNVPTMEMFEGLRGPYNRNLQLYDEQRIDNLLRNVLDLDTAELSVPLS
jgi:hypothetical protein